MQGTVVLCAPHKTDLDLRRPVAGIHDTLCTTFLAVDALSRIPIAGFKEGTIKHRNKLAERQAQKAALDASVRKALTAAKKAEKAADLGPVKRRENSFLARYLAVSLYGIRPADGYTARSYNLSKQVIGLIDHLFVKYPVPFFLYSSMLSFEGLALVFDRKMSKKERGTTPWESKYRSWFLAVAQGQSFAKVAKDVFTKKEAHLFLHAPPGNTIEQNILWAKAAAADVPKAGCDYLVEKLDKEFQTRLGERLPDVLRFYAGAWHFIGRYDRDEITDFIRAAAQNKSFSFKGRTYGSIQKLCREWHRTVYVGHIGTYACWRQTFPGWETTKKGIVIRAVEITNNRALADEGKRQKHCVYTYTQRCQSGYSAIVSLRWFVAEDEATRLTLEISPPQRTIVQIRGKLNRQPTKEEIEVVRLWAGEHGLTLTQYAYW